MGMAASQARLLSITSRMADNELRAQIINNSKMRLATESSKVSEEYVSALNSATMMMSNYDVDGNSQYQKLSFNSLTSYSAHNSQYGLVNANGKLLVSEKDYDNYKASLNADDPLTEFLGKYGLEYGTKYFDNLTGVGDYKLGGTEDYPGKTYSVNELEAMYTGTDGHEGWQNILNSSDYNNFIEAHEKYELANKNYSKQMYKTMVSDVLVNNTTWTQLGANITNGSSDVNVMKGYMNNILNIVTGYTTSRPPKLNLDSIAANDFYEELKEMNNALTVTGSNSAILANEEEITYDAEGNAYFGIAFEKSDGSGDIYQYQAKKNNNGGYDIYYVTADAEGICSNYEYQSKSAAVSATSKDVELSDTSTDENGNSYTKTVKYKDLYSALSSKSKIVDIDEYLNAEEVQAYAESMYNFVENKIIEVMNKEAFINSSDPAMVAAKAEYEGLASQISTSLFGVNDKNIYDSLLDMGWIINNSKADGYNDANGLVQKVTDVAVLNDLFDVYGEPQWGWIDKNNSAENADAKVQWYTNLFERMQQGCKVIENGLASSNEWIQFALESGIVTMEQVDTNNNWVSTIYTNCSNITEVTDDVAVTKAEAEYTKAMNAIEAKDQRYDMELKNIDTEHNSLQTEYDSVKSVIDKNIERSFKIYS